MKAVVGKQYRHYKNQKEYVVLSIGIHTETHEEMVVYEGQYRDSEFGNNPVWVRPRAMFEEEVVLDEKKISRFKAI